ncbi:MAG: glycerophosphodiester phosphodiesterase [Ignavibacteriae bacterium]|nr:glycerophosphodiester phosphodiesterase [Ignavibacteriota bacterium]
MFNWLECRNRPVIIAHRGASAIAPENTLAAFSLAIDAGTDAIELDVQLSKDNSVVVIHDFRLNRTTNRSGVVKHYGLHELKQLSAGSWFSARFAGETIPTLEEVLWLVRGRVGINIELKHRGTTRDGETLVEKTVQLIEHSKAEHYCLLSSFQHSLVRYAHQLNNKISSGYLCQTLSLAGNLLNVSSKRFSPQFIFCSKYLARKKMYARFRQKGLITGTYTITTEKDLQKALRYETECLFTNNPAETLSQLKNTAFG